MHCYFEKELLTYSSDTFFHLTLYPALSLSLLLRYPSLLRTQMISARVVLSGFGYEAIDLSFLSRYFLPQKDTFLEFLTVIA